MNKVKDLLRGNFWMIDLSRVYLSQTEIDFLKIFFDCVIDRMLDDLTCQERVFLILTKKEKSISNSFIN
jgi:hypothetical protein